MVLTNKQRGELHAAVLEFLHASGFEQSAAEFARESEASKASSGGLLEKKWSMVVKQQKKIMDLEKKLKEKEEELAMGGGGGGGGASRRKGGELLPTSTPLHSKQGHRNPITGVVFHPTFGVVVTTAEDATARVWDCESGEHERTLKGHTNAVQDAAFNKNGQVLATCSADFTIKLWDFNEGLCVKTMKGHEHCVSSVAFLPDPQNDKLVSASRDATIKMWDTSSGFCVKTFVGHEKWVRRVVPNAQGNLLASCSDDQSIRLWDVASGKCLESQIMYGHEHIIETVAWLPPKSVATVVASVDFASHFPPDEVAAAGGAETKPLLLSGSRDKTIMLWDGATATCLKVYTGHNNWVRTVWLGCQGKNFFSCSDDKSVRVWDLSNGRNTKTTENAHSHFVTAMGFSSNQRLMATGGVDNVLNIWQCR
jgi:platelet-activating factor acetylhydrolase IB subunit alpha